MEENRENKEKPRRARDEQWKDEIRQAIEESNKKVGGLLITLIRVECGNQSHIILQRCESEIMITTIALYRANKTKQGVKVVEEKVPLLILEIQEFMFQTLPQSLQRNTMS